MLNFKILKPHFYVYWKTQKILLLIFFTILIVFINPNGEVIYFATGTVNEITSIDLIPGKWDFTLTFNDATDGKYALRAYIKDK